MKHSEFGREVINTDTIRKMSRDELTGRLCELLVPLDDTESDDDLRDLLVSSIELDAAYES